MREDRGYGALTTGIASADKRKKTRRSSKREREREDLEAQWVRALAQVAGREEGGGFIFWCSWRCARIFKVEDSALGKGTEGGVGVLGKEL